MVFHENIDTILSSLKDSNSEKSSVQNGDFLNGIKSEITGEISNEFATEIHSDAITCETEQFDPLNVEINNMRIIENQNGPVNCDYCNKIISKGNLKRHIEDVHEGQKKFECEHCNKTFSQKCNLKTHVLNVHFGKKFKCQKCQKTFNQKQIFLNHMKIKHNNKNKITKQFKCKQCDKEYIYKSALENHIKTFHKFRNEENKFVIKGEDEDLSEHEINEYDLPKYEHHNGQVKNENEHEIDEYDLSNITNKSGPIKCAYCNKTVSSKGNLKRHIEGVHKGQQKYKCELCNKSFSQKCNLKTHKLKYHKEKPFKIKVDQKRVFNKMQPKDKLKNHMKTAHEKVENVVKIKLQRNLKIEDLSEHEIDDYDTLKPQNDSVKLNVKNKIRRKSVPIKIKKPKHEEEDLSEYEIDNYDVLENRKNNQYKKKQKYAPEKTKKIDKFTSPNNRNKFGPFKCKYCDKKIISKGNLKRHIEDVHEGQKKYECEFCNRNFSQKCNLKNHQFKVHKGKKFKCETCQKYFNHEKILQNHMKISHKAKPKSDKLYIQKSVSENHIDILRKTNKNFQKDKMENEELSEHEIDDYDPLSFDEKFEVTNLKEIQPNKNLKCHLCYKNFSGKSHLKLHIKTVHEGQKNFQCQHCDRKFSQSYNLTNHIQVIHNKIRKFKCDQCYKIFGLKGNLQNHQKRIHGKKDFKCTFCSRTFGVMFQLKIHMQNNHEGLKKFKCEFCGKRFGYLINLKGILLRIWFLKAHISLDLVLI